MSRPRLEVREANIRMPGKRVRGITRMARPNDSGTGERLRSAWGRLAPLPGGKRLFSLLFGRFVPYSGSVRPLIDALEPGHARVLLRDRRAVRNHLRSIHAIALVNAGRCPPGPRRERSDVQAILTGITIEYEKKRARDDRGQCAGRHDPPAGVGADERPDRRDGGRGRPDEGPVARRAREGGVTC
jgi:hypothetical protein